MRRFDLRSLRFGDSSETWRVLPVEVDPFRFGGEQYSVAEGVVDLRLDATRVGGHLITLDASLETCLHGPCQRCLDDIELTVHNEMREVVSHGESEGAEEDGEEAYVRNFILAADRLVRDLIAEALPSKLLCRDDCRGLCPVCGENLNRVDENHVHAATSVE
jgi:uncharacterized protein